MRVAYECDSENIDLMWQICSPETIVRFIGRIRGNL